MSSRYSLHPDRGFPQSSPHSRTEKRKEKTVHNRFFILHHRLLASAKRAPERGDVPGWVLIVLMTAGLVVAIWALAGPALSEVFTDAIARVRSQ